MHCIETKKSLVFTSQELCVKLRKGRFRIRRAGVAIDL